MLQGKQGFIWRNKIALASFKVLDWENYPTAYLLILEAYCGII